jgi:hypothetical protein
VVQTFYMELLSRAVAFLREHGPATPAELAEHVFGGPGFAPLLDSLAGDRLEFKRGLWRVRPADGETAILELLASGPNPRRHRVVEVAAQRGSARFEASIAGPRPAPALLRRLGVPQQTDGWPDLEETAAELRAFLEGATIAGFGFVPEFVEQLLGPGWPAIDLLRLARCTGFQGRSDPASMARHYGLTPPPGRRPAGMLAFSAALLDCLSAGHSMAELLALGAPARSEPPALPALAEEPGVYVMASAAGRALYVGKSGNLKRRVSSYLRTPIGISRNQHDLMALTRRIDIVPVDSELEAALLEQRLIEDWLPPFNVQRRRGDRPRWLRLSTGEAFPRLTPASQPRADGATYFGPFRHATAATRLRDLLALVLRLRTCTRRLPPPRRPRPACAKAASGACLAPCVPGPPIAPYGREVELARQLLSSSPDEFRGQLRRLLRERPPSVQQAPRVRRKLGALAAGAPPALDLSLWD